MTRKFDFNLPVRTFFPLFIGFYIPFLLLYVISLASSSRASASGNPSGSLGITLLCTLGMVLLYVFFTIPFLRRVVPAVSLDGKTLAFRGAVWPFVGINLLGIFLSIITLGIYSPWYITRVTRYLAAETSYDGRQWAFQGRGGRLFVILLLTLVVPIVVLMGLLLLILFSAGMFNGRFSGQSQSSLITMVVTYLVVFLVIPAYAYEFYRWYAVNLRIGDAAVRWSTRFWPSVGTILLQIFLTIITVSVYFPAAYVRLYGYFARRTSFVREGGTGPNYALGFEAPPGLGFGLIWGQTLLTLITAGIYAPWAMVRIGRWFAAHTTVSPQEENVRPSSSMAT